MKGVVALALLASLPLVAQEDFHVEVTGSAWRTGISGALQTDIRPVDLQRDLNLQDQYTFFGRLVFKPARKHRIVVEGAPYHFEGTNTLSRTIVYGGRTFNVQDTISSSADMTYFFGGYQYDFLSGHGGHLGAQVGGAYIDATGSITSAGLGATASRSQTLGIPLVGLDFRVYLIPGSSLLSVSGDAKGMSLGSYGHYVQGGIHAGVGTRHVTFMAGYMILDADVHEKDGGVAPAGISPRISGPVFSVQFRY